MKALVSILIAIGLGAAVYCCGPKSKTPRPGPVCSDGGPEICKHDDTGDYDCFCKE